MTIWGRRTGWRPVEVAQADPHAPFVLADVRHFSAARRGKWAAAAVALFLLAAALNNILLTRVATLSLTTKLLLAAAVTVILVAMARALQPQARCAVGTACDVG